MRIGLVYDLFDDYPWEAGDPADADAENEPPETVDVLVAAIRRLGHTPVRIGTAYDLLIELPDLRIDCGLSIAEGVRGRIREAYAATLFELAGIPYLGSDPLTLSLSLDKAWTKDLVAAAGIPTPPYRVYAGPEAIDPDNLPGPFPLFVKPRYEGSSKGIFASSKIYTLEALRNQVARVTAAYRQEVIVEPFIEGSEFTVAVIGNAPPEPLPVLQRAVDAVTGIGVHALEHRGVGSTTVAQPAPYAPLTAELEARLQDLAVRIYEKLQCRDFARLDFRVDLEGRPWFLEINPLPTFAPDGTFAIVAELMHRPYVDFLADVLQRGLRRLKLA
jgi:D-alanine-D-alanine ligase